MKLTRREWALTMMAQAPLDHPLKQIAIPSARRVSSPRKKNKREEDTFQIACCQLLDTLPDTDYFAIPNHLYLGKSHSEGEKWGKINYMKKQQRMGLKKGMFDLVIGFESVDGKDQTLGFECKKIGGVYSDEQNDMAIKWTKRGWICGGGETLNDLTALLRVAGHPAFQR